MEQLESLNENNDIERSVTATQCHCRNYKAGLKNCRCRKIRQSVSGNVSESELMNHETKLIVLEFLRALTPEKLTARSKSIDAASSGPSSRSASIDVVPMETASTKSHNFQPHDDNQDILRQIKQMSDFKEDYSSPKKDISLQGDTFEYHSKYEEVTLRNVNKQPQTVRKNKVPRDDDDVKIPSPNDRKRTDAEIEAKRANAIKYNTIAIGEEEHKEFVELLHKQLESQKVSLESTGGVKLGRSRSDVTSEKYAAVRDKISAMKAPVEEWLEKYSNVETTKVLHDIKGFDKTSLNKTKKTTSTITNKKKWSERKNQGLRYINLFITLSINLIFFQIY